jgi:hypothetical protein
MRLFAATAIAVLATLAGTSVAAAKSPPAGKYECTISGTWFGELRMTGATTYTRNGKKGMFVAGTKLLRWKDKTVPGYTIEFKTGSLKGFKGRWYRSNTGINEIALRNPLNGFESIYCDD